MFTQGVITNVLRLC